MNLTIVEAPRTTAFTTLARMRRELGLASTDTSKDERLTDLIEEVSAEIVAYCGQPLIRQQVTERQVGFGRTVQQLTVTPVPPSGISQVRYSGATISGWSVSNPEAGQVFLNQWPDTRPTARWIEADPAIMPGEPLVEFDYIGGYLLPGDDVTCSGNCIASASDNSFNVTDETFPLLVAGEYVTVTGFDDEANQGRFRVVSRTETKLIVDATLVDETPSGISVIAVRTLPRDIESAAVSEIRGRYKAQDRDPAVTSEKLGDWGASYGGASESSGGLLDSTALRLSRYVRLD